MKRTGNSPGRDNSVPALLALLQQWLWYNDKYKLFFSSRHTNNPQEYYWFMLDIASGKRTHGHYRVTTEAIVLNMFGAAYKVRELANMRRYDLLIVQMTNADNELNYYNWIGIALPAEKGTPYNVTKLYSTI